MEESRFQGLREFISDQVGVNPQEVIPETRLYEDLGVYGDDDIDLLISYGKRCKVDVSKFIAADYFSGEGVNMVGRLIRLFTGKQPASGLKVLTVNDLEKGVLAGNLDEEVIAGPKDSQ
jgi:hypothetical protein